MAMQSLFARELQSILDKTSLSAELIVAELNRQGFPLSLRTFSQWQQGKFLPRFDTAFTVVGLLSDICGAPSDRLANALLRDLSSPAYGAVDGTLTEDVLTMSTTPENTYETYMTLLGEKVEWSADLTRKAIRDNVYVNKDFTQFTHKVTVLVVVPQAPNPSLTISSVYEDGERPLGDEYFYDIKGAQLGKQSSYVEDGDIVHGVQLFLGDDVEPGQLHELSYTWSWEADKPTYKVGERYFSWQLDFYSSTVTFEGDMPRDIQYVAYNPDDKTDSSVLDIPIIRDDTSARIMMRDFGHINAYFLCSED